MLFLDTKCLNPAAISLFFHLNDTHFFDLWDSLDTLPQKRLIFNLMRTRVVSQLFCADGIYGDSLEIGYFFLLGKPRFVESRFYQSTYADFYLCRSRESSFLILFTFIKVFQMDSLFPPSWEYLFAKFYMYLFSSSHQDCLPDFLFVENDFLLIHVR